MDADGLHGGMLPVDLFNIYKHATVTSVIHICS